MKRNRFSCLHRIYLSRKLVVENLSLSLTDTYLKAINQVTAKCMLWLGCCWFIIQQKSGACYMFREKRFLFIFFRRKTTHSKLKKVSQSRHKNQRTRFFTFLFNKHRITKFIQKFIIYDNTLRQFGRFCVICVTERVSSFVNWFRSV